MIAVGITLAMIFMVGLVVWWATPPGEASTRGGAGIMGEGSIRGLDGLDYERCEFGWWKRVDQPCTCTRHRDTAFAQSLKAREAAGETNGRAEEV